MSSTNNRNRFIVLPSERLLQYSPANQTFTLHLNTKAEDYAVSHHKLALISGKAVKYYDIENGFTSASVPILESYFPKKVQGITIDTEDKIVVTDKFGDIYEARPQNSLYLNSNLGIPTFMKHIKNNKNNKEYILLGDDYCKLKVYNYKNMHEITAIWYIPNSVPLDVLQISDETVVLLVNHQDKENLKHTYKLYQFRVSDLDQPDFSGSLIHSDKTETLNNSEYHPCSVTYCQETGTLFFLKLYDERIEVVSLTSENIQNQTLSVCNKFDQQLKNPIKDGNSIEGFYVADKNEKFLLVSYGKYHSAENQDRKQEIKVEMGEFQKDTQASATYKINENEFLLRLKLN